MGAANFETEIKHSYRVWYAAILSGPYSPFQKRLLQRRTYQLLNFSCTKSEINRAAFVGS